MIQKVWIPEPLYRAWPLLTLSMSGIAVFGVTGWFGFIVGTLLLIYSGYLMVLRRTMRRYCLPVVLIIILSGCAEIPTGKKTTTLNNYDNTGKTISTTTITETNVSPDAISQAASDMVQACYSSFEAEYDIKDAYITKLTSDDLKDILIFREFRVGLQTANGYTPRDVCKNPETVYTYAKAHDEALFNTISKISGDAFGAAESMTPFIALWKLGETAAKEAGDLFGDDGTKTTNGRDGITSSSDASLTGTGDSKETTEIKQSGVTESTLSPDLSTDDSKTEVVTPEATTESAT